MTVLDNDIINGLLEHLKKEGYTHAQIVQYMKNLAEQDKVNPIKVFTIDNTDQERLLQELVKLRKM